MKLLQAIPDITTRSVYLSWVDFPIGTSGFRIDLIRRGAPADQSSGDSETATILGTTANSFYTDMLYFDKSIIRRDHVYRISALDSKGEVSDQLIVRPMDTDSTLVQKVINAANYKAQLLFRNYNWAQVVYILRPKRTGQKCTCYSRDFKSSNNPDCQVCYGTGYVGGFYTPIPTKYLSIKEETTDPSIDENKPAALGQRFLTIPRYPAVYKGDFLASDMLGLLSVISSSKKTVQTTPTPTTMVTTVALGREHPAHKFDFNAAVPSIDRFIMGDGTVALEGTNLIPVIGSVKIVIEEGPEELDSKTYTALDIKSMTSTKIVFKSDTKILVPQPYIKYKVFLNNIMFEKTQFPEG